MSPQNRIEMAATQHLYYASNHQPALVIAGLLDNPLALGLLTRLRGQSLTLAQLDLNLDQHAILRRLRQVNLVLAYQIGGVVKYRAHRYPPMVQQALAA